MLDDPVRADAAPADAGDARLFDAGAAPSCAVNRVNGLVPGLTAWAHEDTSGAAAGVAWTFLPMGGFEQAPDEDWQLVIALAGPVGELERAGVLDLSSQSDLQTCTHCVYGFRDCDSVPSDCIGPPFIATAGQLYVFRAPALSELGGSFDVEIRGARLTAARVDDATLSTSLAPDEGCVDVDWVRVAGVVSRDDCESSRFGCRLTQTAAGRSAPE